MDTSLYHESLFCLFKACAEIEKSKGCLCLSPATLELSVENKKETFEENELPYHQLEDINIMESMERMQTEQVEKPQVLAGSKDYQSNSNMNDSSNVIYNESIESTLLQNNLALSINATPNAEECKTEFDFSDCIASLDMNNLKMLSLLDFAGHSAYYVCHHIFFSPRAFFILVVDMTKSMETEATESCKKRNLIYSNWTYAGNFLDSPINSCTVHVMFTYNRVFNSCSEASSGKVRHIW